MPLPESLAPLLKAEAYPHPCDGIELVETHISWVLLTGDFAYKLKKPVDFNFVDFSSLEKRAHFCNEELRCNRAFAPDLYLDVVPVTRSAQGALRISGPGEVVEWAVKMRQFPTDRQVDRLLAAGQIPAAELQAMLRRFGERLALQHRELPRLSLPASADLDGELKSRVAAPMEENFRALKATSLSQRQAEALAFCTEATRAELARQRKRLQGRITGGFVRECHGDLHLANLVALEPGITAFDCLEFNPNLRWIDTISDAAFLFMDCAVRNRGDLAYVFMDGYADVAGDYQGLALLPLYAAYRSMVRAKVAALQLAQNPGNPESARRLDTHLAWAASRWRRGASVTAQGIPASREADLRERPRLILMCGLSGSGKSHLAARLVPALEALRLRSDVLRRTLAGLTREAHSGAPLGGGLYAPDQVGRVYEALEELSTLLLRAGETVIVDATFLDGRRRRAAVAQAARAGIPAVVVYCDAPYAVLRERVSARMVEGSDPSEAGVDVLDAQRRYFQPPEPDEPTVRVDTSGSLDLDSVVTRLRAV